MYMNPKLHNSSVSWAYFLPFTDENINLTSRPGPSRKPQNQDLNPGLSGSKPCALGSMLSETESQMGLVLPLVSSETRPGRSQAATGFLASVIPSPAPKFTGWIQSPLVFTAE